MDVLIISAHYEPEPNFVTTALAKHLRNEGHFLEVFTAFPNYPLGRFYDSVDSLLPRKTEENDLWVWRLPFIPDHSRSKVKRAVSYLSFTLIVSVFSFLCAKKPAVVIVYQTPFTTALAALWFKYIHKTKVYFISCDLWPESFTASKVLENGLMMKLAYFYSRWINRRADFIVCSTQGILKRYVNDKIPRTKLAYVPVWTDGIPANPTYNSLAKFNSKKLVYAGNIGAAQGLEVLVETAKILEEQDSDFFIDVYGSGTELERLRILSANSERIKFYGRVAPEVAYNAMNKATAVLVHLTDTPLFRMTLPSKLAGAFAAGGIVLAGLVGEGAELVESSRAGFSFAPGNAESLALLLQKVGSMQPDEYEKYVSKSINFYSENFDRSELLKYYTELVESGKTSGIKLS